MHTILELIDCFKKNNYTCLIANKGEIVFTAFDKGVKPLLDFYQAQKEHKMNHLQLIDKVIGKGAAFLCVLIGIKEIHTRVISKSALTVLERNGIPVSYEILTDYIMNAKKDGHCPVETISEEHDDPESFYPALLNFFAKRE